ncbi:MAG TPA: GDP-mannose 4,6-dehydratase [Candidatus Sulfotelmatobacter sp.]|nr:GDP-mannose 4,6-dehydratase [Candidatus Sulfotelmatobacter sp.]
MSKKILITGASGFVGGHLLDYLYSQGEKEIYGTYFSNKTEDKSNKNDVDFLKIDLKEEDEVFNLIKDIRPDIIYHLAAFTSGADSFSSPKETVLNNISSQINLLQAVFKNNLKDTKILITSSAEIYGKVKKEDLPIDEQTAFNPTNPYAVSKLTQDFLGKQYFLSYGLKILIARPFNHIGPKQSSNFVVSAFAKKIAEIEKGNREPILTVGNLDSKRDFTDVRDVVKAYQLIVEKGVFGEAYNVGSGKSYKISQILDMLLSFSKVKVKVEVDTKLLRPVDNPDLVCNAEKLKKLTGWEPKIEIAKTLKDTLDYWRNII